MTGPELATMTVEEALPYADDVVEKWPTGFSQLDRAALKTLKEEVRRLQGLMPFFSRLPSFAAWVEDAKATTEEVKRWQRHAKRVENAASAALAALKRLEPNSANVFVLEQVLKETP